VDELYAAETAIRDAVPIVLSRRRAAGVLTWKLLHQIEDEVFSVVSRNGRSQPSHPRHVAIVADPRVSEKRLACQLRRP